MHGYTRWVIVKELVASVGHEGRDVLQHEGSVRTTGVSHATHPATTKCHETYRMCVRKKRWRSNVALPGTYSTYIWNRMKVSVTNWKLPQYMN